MTVKSRGFLRHVALSVADPWETAEFYKATVGLEEVSEIDGPLAEGVFLTVIAPTRHDSTIALIKQLSGGSTTASVR